MTRTETPLRDAIAHASTPADARVVAILAGRTRRHGPHPDLAPAEAWRDGAGRTLLEESWRDLDLPGIEDAVLTVEGTTPEAEALAAIRALDDLCAAATWAGCPRRLAPSVDLVSRTVRAFPEAWARLSAEASRVLQEAPPVPGDPARGLWTAIEGAARIRHARPGKVEIPRHLRARLGLARARVSLGPVTLPLAAAGDALPEAPPWIRLDGGPHWDLALTLRPVRGRLERAMVLTLRERVSPITFERDGARVDAEVQGDDHVCAAEPGAWVITAGDARIELDLVP